MTERNRKQEESRSASKPRPAYHSIPSQLAAPGSAILPHPGAHLAPDVTAGLSASSFAYSMIQPPYQTHIVVPPLHRQNSRTNPVASLTADPIGPPMFMPSLNLGVPTGMFPSSSSSSNPSHAGSSVKPTSASNSLSTSNSFAFQPTSFSATKSATTNLKTPVLNPVKKGDGNGGNRTPQPLPSVQSVKQAAAVHGRGSPPLPPSSSISLVKPTITSSIELPNAAGGGHMTYTTPLYPSHSGMIGMAAVGGGMVVAGSNSGIMTPEGLFACQGQPMPHGNLLCTEGVSLSSSSSTGRPTGGTAATISSSNSFSSSSSTSTVPTNELFESRPVFPTVLPVNTNHRFHSSHPSSPITSSDSMLTTYHHHAVRPAHISPHIPRPEAVSKNIIIPAPNLTGKDIASLTSSAHSSEANTPTSERPSNDLCLSSSDSLPQETAVTSAPQLPSVNRIPLASMVATPTARTLSSPSSPSLPSGGLSLMDTSLQQGSSSPRPSILRKRPLDRQTEGLSGAVSPSMFLTNPLRTTNSSAVLSSEPSSTATSGGRDCLENHLRDAEFTSSPRKRPRKQHFDNIGDNYYGSLSSQNEAQGSGVTSPLDPPHPSMFANERLPGPLPLKTKTSKTDLVSPVVPEPGDDKAHKEVGVLYLAQLRKSPYPINGCLRVNHRAAHSHFKRHADIKHREETRTSLHDIASSDSSWLRASGWKIELFERNLHEMREAEGEMLEAVQRIQSDLSSLLSSAHCSLPTAQTRLLQEVIQGNVDRSTRVQSHVDECSEKMLMVLDHSPRIMDLLKRYGGSRTNYSASAKHHT